MSRSGNNAIKTILILQVIEFIDFDFIPRQVGIAGSPKDRMTKKTKTVEDCWSPVWEEEFDFPLTIPELAVLRIEVHEYDMSEKDDFAGQACLPVAELRPGIRSVLLSDRKGNPFKNARLLLRFGFSLPDSDS